MVEQYFVVVHVRGSNPGRGINYKPPEVHSKKEIEKKTLWCNGNTTVSKTVDPGSIPGRVLKGSIV